MKYRIGWRKDGKYHYIYVDTKAEMLEEVADKTTISDRVIVKVVKVFKLGGTENEVND